jgi:hypothetical protein
MKHCSSYHLFHGYAGPPLLMNSDEPEPSIWGPGGNSLYHIHFLTNEDNIENIFMMNK